MLLIAGSMYLAVTTSIEDWSEGMGPDMLSLRAGMLAWDGKIFRHISRPWRPSARTHLGLGLLGPKMVKTKQILRMWFSLVENVSALWLSVLPI